MRRLLWPIRTPPRRATIVAAVALSLLARYVPFAPRWCGPAGGHFPIGFSPDGRQFAVHNEFFFSTFDHPFYDPVYVHDLSDARTPRRDIAARLFPPNVADPPTATWLLWEYLRDPSIRRRLLTQVFGEAALGPDEGDWPALGVERASPDRRYWAYRTVDGVPDEIGRDAEFVAVRLVVREVESGRVVLTTPVGFHRAAFGPGPDTLTAVHYEVAGNDITYRVERWNLSTGQCLTGSSWPRFPSSPGLSADGRFVIRGSSEPSRFHVHDTLNDFRLVNSFSIPQPHDYWLDNHCAGDRRFAVAVTGGGGGSAWLRVWTLGREEPVERRAPPGHRLCPAAVAPDGSQVAVTVTPDDTAASWPWQSVLDFAERWGIELRPRPRLWLVDAATGGVTAELAGGPEELYLESAVFADDGRQLAVVGSDEVLRIYDLPLRRPWQAILGWAGALTLGFAALDFVAGKLRRRPGLDPFARTNHPARASAAVTS